ncbi:hypothetical protein F5887DRAFT_1078395 [Amanita rubescens]|nr:hypothetical protein F5887DRAFT_924128 [Amanita rubescens]KAF8337136.1 hypothetical protein F5887DRAFT_1078395 [Amanita rubescens]
MSSDLEAGFVLPQSAEILAYDERVNTSSDSLEPGTSKVQVSGVKIKQKPVGGKKGGKRSSGRRHKSGEIEAKAWEGRVPERLKLVQKGYQALAIICTFLAGVQVALFARTATQTDVSAQIVNGFFFAGLLADIGAAILSAASQRWFEMIRREEAEHVYDYLNKPHSSEIRPEEGDQLVVEEKLFSQTVVGKERQEEEHVSNVAAAVVTSKRYVIEQWLFLALKAPPYAAVLGFAFMVMGVMLWVWSHEAIVAKVLCTVLCVLLVILLPPFAIQHDRRETLKRFKLKRVSG